jgi:aquaporin Z
MAYAMGHSSGCHIHKAVAVGLWAGGRFRVSDLVSYVIAPVPEAIAASGVPYVIASGKAGFDLSSGFAANGYADHFPGGTHWGLVCWRRLCSLSSSC